MLHPPAIQQRRHAPAGPISRAAPGLTSDGRDVGRGCGRRVSVQPAPGIAALRQHPVQSRHLPIARIAGSTLVGLVLTVAVYVGPPTGPPVAPSTLPSPTSQYAPPAPPHPMTTPAP